MGKKYSNSRKAAKRRQTILVRLILMLVILLLSALVVFLARLVSGEGDDSAATTAAGTETQTTGAPEATDASGIATGEVTVNTDVTAPVISGLPEQISVEVGGTVSYKSGVTVTDDTDPDPTLTIDNSAVNLSVAGTYKVLYSATDAAGNSSMRVVEVIVTEPVTEPVATDEEIAQMKYLAGLYLKQIITEDMTDYEKAERIWLWVNWNCDYTSTSDKSSWVRGAIQYFETHKGDCFNYFAAAKALLEQAGIETIDVVKSDTSHSSHYWSLVNLGDGWYHFDTTPRDGSGDFFFLVTDEQLDAYSEAHGGSHTFDHNAYTARATKIITDMDDQPSYYSFFKE